MSVPPVCVRKRAHVAEAAGVMLKLKVHRLPVVDDRNVPVGCTHQNRPISVCRLGEMPTQSCGRSVHAPRVKVGARLNAHTELRAKRQRSARGAIYRNGPIKS
jgi:CBS domain-containing protein